MNRTKPSIQDTEIYTADYFLQDNICRLCWNHDATKEMLSENSEDNVDVKNVLLDKISYCLGLEFPPDSYPKKTCSECYNNVEKYYIFKTSCIETERRLQEILKSGCNVVNKDNEEVKIEKDDQFQESEINTPVIESCEDSFQCDENSDTEKKTMKKRKVKKQYKPKRSPTYCNICRSDLISIENLKLHNLEYHGIENGEFKCFGCNNRYKNRKTRVSHEVNFCKGLKDGYKCQLCDRYLPNRKMYESHTRDHRNNKDTRLPESIFKCGKCYKLFKSKESLKKHISVHNTGKKKFICESCGRVFTRQDYLHKHKLVHSGEKLHVCPHCSYRTAQRSSLLVHIRKHTGERPYSCDLCPQKCVSSSNLRAHRRGHLGLKTYECTICSKKFSYKASLREHVEAAHDRSQTHPCQLCGAIYTRKRGLKRHLLAKHENETVLPTDTDGGKKVTKKDCNESVDKVNLLKSDTYELHDGDVVVINGESIMFKINTQ